MFIKFSDKTKKIIVKNSSDKHSNGQIDGYSDEEVLFLDEKDEKNRRIKVLSDLKEGDSDNSKA